MPIRDSWFLLFIVLLAAMSSDRFRHVVDLLRRLLMCTFEDMHSGRSGDMHLPSLGIYGELCRRDTLVCRIALLGLCLIGAVSGYLRRLLMNISVPFPPPFSHLSPFQLEFL